MHVSAVSFQAKDPALSGTVKDKRKKQAEGAVIGTGAAAGAAKKAGFSVFKTTNKVGMITRETRDAIQVLQKPVQQTKTLFGNFGKLIKAYTKKIVTWSENFKKTPFMKAVLENKLALGAASLCGFGLAVLTLIAGVTNTAKASAFAIENYVQKSEFLNSLNDDKE